MLYYYLIDNNAQLENRHHNAALLRYVDSVRTHGHRAARIDPLDLIPRDSEVAALNPSRYGLKDGSKRYNVNGIIWTNPKVEAQRNDTEEWWTLDEITRHLREVYVGKIAYEVRMIRFLHSCSYWFSLSTCTHNQRRSVFGSLTCLNLIQCRNPSISS